MEYVNTLPEKVSDIAKSIDSVMKQLKRRGTHPEWDDLEGLLHKLSGSSGTYGFSGLSEVARYMEEAITDQVITKLEPKDAVDHIKLWNTIFEEVSDAAVNGKNDAVDQELSRLQDHVLFFLTKRSAA